MTHNQKAFPSLPRYPAVVTLLEACWLLSASAILHVATRRFPLLRFLPRPLSSPKRTRLWVWNRNPVERFIQVESELSSLSNSGCRASSFTGIFSPKTVAFQLPCHPSPSSEIRGDWEKEQDAKRGISIEPSEPAKDKEREPQEPEP